MVELARLTRPKIIRQVGETSLHKALNYLAENRWTALRLRGGTIKGRCQGNASAPYRVSVTFDGEDEIADANCSCPVGAGGHCKHVAAILLFYREHPDAFIETEDLDAALDRRSKSELIALIRRMVRRAPELEALLEAPLPGYTDPAAADAPELYRRQAAAAFEQGCDDGRRIEAVARELADIVAVGEEFRNVGVHPAAVAAYRSVAEEVLERFEGIEDEQGALLEVVSECAEGLCACLQAAPQDATYRDKLIHALTDLYIADESHGGLGVSDSIPDALLHQTTPEERRHVAVALRERLPHGESWSDEFQRRAIGSFLLELEAADSVDEPYEWISRHREEAESHIQQRTRDAYRCACNHLKEAAELSKRLNENGMWEEYVNGLRDRYRSLRALHEEMDRAGL